MFAALSMRGLHSWPSYHIDPAHFTASLRLARHAPALRSVRVALGWLAARALPPQ